MTKNVLRVTFINYAMTLINDIYPGQYHPHTANLQQATHYGDALICQSRYSKIQLVDGNYQISLPVPGVARENVFIEVSGNHMIIKIVDRQRLPENIQGARRIKVVRKCFITLPQDADANFAAAKIQHSQLTIDLSSKCISAAPR